MDILIIEDEQFAADKLEKLILTCDPAHNILQKIQSVDSAVKWFVANGSPDLLFLDIHLMDGNCFEIIDQVEIACPVIFTTAYDEYALRAFQLQSIDYLLKPISLQKVEKAFEKMESMQQHVHAYIGREELRKVVSQLFPAQISYKSRFIISKKDQLLSISVDDIQQIFSEDRLSFILSTRGEKYAIHHSLNELERLLNPQDFFRINRQKILHIQNIKSVYRHFNGRLKIELTQAPEEVVIVSSRRVSDFQKWLDR